MLRAPQNETTIYNITLRIFISLKETTFGNNDK